MISFMPLHIGCLVYHPLIPPFFHMMKIQQTRHKNQVFLQVFAYQYHKDLGGYR